MASRKRFSSLGWHKSTASGPDSACVEVAFDRFSDAVFVRDSKAQEGAVLSFTRAEWDAFLVGVRRGEFDR